MWGWLSRLLRQGGGQAGRQGRRKGGWVCGVGRGEAQPFAAAAGVHGRAPGIVFRGMFESGEGRGGGAGPALRPTPHSPLSAAEKTLCGDRLLGQETVPEANGKLTRKLAGS